MYFSADSFLRERPGQHELGLENGPAGLDSAVQSSAHPSERWVPDPPLDVRDDLQCSRFGMGVLALEPPEI